MAFFYLAIPLIVGLVIAFRFFRFRPLFAVPLSLGLAALPVAFNFFWLGAMGLYFILRFPPATGGERESLRASHAMFEVPFEYYSLHFGGPVVIASMFALVAWAAARLWRRRRLGGQPSK